MTKLPLSTEPGKVSDTPAYFEMGYRWIIEVLLFSFVSPRSLIENLIKLYNRLRVRFETTILRKYFRNGNLFRPNNRKACRTVISN